MAASDTYRGLLGLFSGTGETPAYSSGTPEQINMSGPLGLGLRGLSMVPGPVGWLGTIGSLAARGNNIGYTNRARASWGQGDLDFGQTIGALLGLNSYGGGSSSDKLGDFRGTAVTPSGVTTQGGFLGIGGETVGAYTPGEAQRRNAAALYGNSFGTPVQTAQTMQAAPVAAPMVNRNDFGADDMSRFANSPDPIGAAIRSWGKAPSEANTGLSAGGGRSGGNGANSNNGGFGGGYGGGVGPSRDHSMSSGHG